VLSHGDFGERLRDVLADDVVEPGADALGHPA
jgi:hypothetical protein